MLTFDEYLKMDDSSEDYIRGFLKVRDNVKVLAAAFMALLRVSAIREGSYEQNRLVAFSRPKARAMLLAVATPCKAASKGTGIEPTGTRNAHR